MTTTRLQQIQELIDSYTQKYVSKNDFSFEDCNAYTISLDLSLDRSNVSRILNQLHSNNQLIKIEGRPTLFISRNKILDFYPSLDIPRVIKKDDGIDNYLYISKEVTQKDLLNVIGLNSNESLYDVSQKLAPYFLYPPTSNHTTISVIGQKGTGKKYLIEEFFLFAKKRSIYSQDSSILYCNLGSIFWKPDKIIESISPRKNPIILMENVHVLNEDVLQSFITDISFLYKNIGINQPLIFILADNQDNFKMENLVIPMKISIPSLENRSDQEILGLGLFFLLKHSKMYNKKIVINKNTIAKFVAYHYRHNCTELFQEIYKFVIKSLYHEDENSPTLHLEPEFLGHHFKPVQVKNKKTKDIISYLPDEINITPNMNINDIRKIYEKKEEQLFLKTAIIKEPIVDKLLIQCKSSLNEFNTNYTNNIFEEKLHGTLLNKDPNLFRYLCGILEEFSENRVSIFKYQVDNKVEISNTTKSIYNMIRYHLLMKGQFNIMESEKFLIQHIIEQAIQLIQKTKTPTLIICHEDNISENYASKFNALSHSRKFFSIDYNKEWQTKGIKAFTSHLLKIIRTINRGNRINLFVDYYPLTIIDSQLVINLKMSLISFSPVSSASLRYIYTPTTSDNVFSTKDYLRTQNRINLYLDKNTLIQKKERNSYLAYMKDLFPTLDVMKSNESFYRSLIAISQNLNLDLTNRIIVDYIYQGNCILENMEIRTQDYVQKPINDDMILNMIKNSLLIQPEFSGILFTDTELSILYNSLYINIPQTKE